MTLMFIVLCVCLQLIRFGHGLHVTTVNNGIMLSVPTLTLNFFLPWTRQIGSVITACNNTFIENGQQIPSTINNELLLGDSMVAMETCLVLVLNMQVCNWVSTVRMHVYIIIIVMIPG